MKNMGLGRPPAHLNSNPGGYRFILIFTHFFLKIYSNHCLHSWIVNIDLVRLEFMSATNSGSAESHQFMWSSHKYLFFWIEYLWIFLMFLEHFILHSMVEKGWTCACGHRSRVKSFGVGLSTATVTSAASFNLFRNFGGLILYRVAYILV